MEEGAHGWQNNHTAARHQSAPRTPPPAPCLPTPTPQLPHTRSPGLHPQDVIILILGICEYGWLHGKDLSLQMKLRLLMA